VSTKHEALTLITRAHSSIVVEDFTGWKEVEIVDGLPWWERFLPNIRYILARLMRFEVLTVVAVKRALFWNATPYRLADTFICSILNVKAVGSS
jgi:hypothetical protein